MNLAYARTAIERLYFDLCTVIEYQAVEDPDTHITSMQEVIVHENVPCKISHKTIQSADTGVAAGINLATKVIINPDIEIKAGSKLLLTRQGVMKAYKCSGEPALYHNHQEIIVELFEDWA